MEPGIGRNTSYALAWVTFQHLGLRVEVLQWFHVYINIFYVCVILFGKNVQTHKN